MYRERNPLLSLGIAITKLIISLIVLICSLTLLVNYIKQNGEAESVTSGVIVGKEINNPYRGLFTSHGTEYYIVIDTGVERSNIDRIINGEGNAEKKFSVSENDYLAYNVGEYFDSYNYKKEENVSR